MLESEERHLIEQVLLRYAWGLDARDSQVVADCFTEDVHAEYAGEQLAPGREAILAYTGARTDAVLATTHAISNVLVAFDASGTAADVDSLGVVALREEADGALRVRMRGIQYTDRFHREPDTGRWRISRRRHAPLWECVMPSSDVAASEPSTPVGLHVSGTR